MIRRLSLALLSLTLVACATLGRVTSRTAKPSVAGGWFFTVDVGTAVTRGAMTLAPRTAAIAAR
ncbi:MAG: hypothetical protein K2X99_04470 [Gemmatimonadaceae bacterium]|nr:hypothetical protein [Gemmatimonadaceae bacterium]